MLIECPFCESKVDAKVAYKREYRCSDDPFRLRVSLAICPRCKNTLVGLQELIEGHPQLGDFWDDATRIWPQPDRNVSWELPPIVRTSLEEARRCFRARAYSASVVMCGRALEGICSHHKTKSSNLNDGLKELLDAGVIDTRIYAWGNELRKVRNIGAHASAEAVSKEDAEDVLEFVHAIGDYVFVLNAKFERLMSRKKKNKE